MLTYVRDPYFYDECLFWIKYSRYLEHELKSIEKEVLYIEDSTFGVFKACFTEHLYAVGEAFCLIIGLF